VLVIRNAQLAALGKSAHDAFVQRAAQHLRGISPGNVAQLSEPDLYENVDSAMRAAAEFRLHSERDCIDFLVLSAKSDWQLTRAAGEPWMVAMLDDPDTFLPSERLRLLHDEFTRCARVQAESMARAARFASGR